MGCVCLWKVRFLQDAMLLNGIRIALIWIPLNFSVIKLDTESQNNFSVYVFSQTIPETVLEVSTLDSQMFRFSLKLGCDQGLS